MGLTLITPATTLPVSLAAVKAHCLVEDAFYDTVLDALRKAACAHVGQVLGRGLGEATWKLTLDAFSDAIELPRGPVLGLVANGFTYLDVAGAPQVVPAGTYTLDLTSTPQWLVRNADESWPEVLDAVGAVAVQFTAGWTESTLPSDLLVAVCSIVAAWFEDRAAAVPKAAEALLMPHRRIRI